MADVDQQEPADQKRTTSLLHLPNETIEIVLSYLIGTPRRGRYASPNVCDWDTLPDFRSLSALSKSCWRLRGLVEPHLFGKAGVYCSSYYSEMRFHLALHENRKFQSYLHYLTIRLDDRGLEEKEAMLEHHPCLRSLELVFTDAVPPARHGKNGLGIASRMLIHLWELSTLRLSFSPCSPETYNAATILKFLDLALRNVKFRSPDCLQLEGINLHTTSYQPPNRSSAYRELTLQNCVLPIPMLTELFKALGISKSLTSLRIDQVTFLKSCQSSEFVVEESDDEYYDDVAGESFGFPVPIWQALGTIPSLIRKRLRSLHIIDPMGDFFSRNAVDPAEPIFANLQKVTIFPVDLVPYVGPHAQHLTVISDASVSGVCTKLQKVIEMLEGGQLSQVRQLRFDIASESSWHYPKEPGHSDMLQQAPTLWDGLEEAYQKYKETVLQHSILVCPDLVIWVEKKRALRRLFQRMEKENEQDEDEDVVEAKPKEQEGEV